jgi:hypothetical protein
MNGYPEIPENIFPLIGEFYSFVDFIHSLLLNTISLLPYF